MPLSDEFWVEPVTYCGKCFSPCVGDLPVTCDCGNVLLPEQLTTVPRIDIVLGRLHHESITEVHDAEDARFLAAVEEAIRASA